MSDAAPFLLSFLLLFVAIWLVSALRGRFEPPAELREIAAYDTIRGAMSEATEEGRPVHVALGIGGISDAAAMDTLAGLMVLEYLSEQAAVTNNMPLVSTGDPTTMLLAQDMLSRVFKEREQLAEFDPLMVRFVGGSDTGEAYAASVVDLLDHGYVAANFMLGRFSDEYLLMGEVTARNNIRQVAGSSDPAVLAFMIPSADQVLLGEELYAAGAYLLNLPLHIADLIAQDATRWILLGAVGGVVLLKTLGLL
jgi:uncharacterized protein DUF6754